DEARLRQTFEKREILKVLWGVLVLRFDITGIRTSASFAQSGALWQNPPPQGADLSPVVPLDPGTATAVSDMLAGAIGVHALFDLRTPTTGPFPTDWFTVCEASHNTRRRVNLPRPDCAFHQSDGNGWKGNPGPRH